MDIFLSYRRGKVDSPNAGRIYDYLHGLGYQIYYDRDRYVNRDGSQYPTVIPAALAECKVIVAVIGPDWVAHKDRLKQEEDLVRLELRHGSPEQRERKFFAVYIGAGPADLDGMPDVLAFVPTATSHLTWTEFEASEKQQLKELLLPWLPREAKAGGVTDLPRLELLCDRSREEGAFQNALDLAAERKVAGWLLFGETDEAPAELFDRIEAFTLKLNTVRRKFGSRASYIRLDLADFDASPVSEMRDHLLTRAADALSIKEPPDFASLMTALSKRCKLAVFHSVVHAEDARQAEWWLKRLQQLRADLTAPMSSKTCVLLAFSITYDSSRRDSSAATFFASLYPGHFSDDGAVDPPDAPFITSRLRPVSRGQVDNWCDHGMVKPHVMDRKKQVLAPFDRALQLPMSKVLLHLRRVLVDSMTPHP